MTLAAVSNPKVNGLGLTRTENPDPGHQFFFFRAIATSRQVHHMGGRDDAPTGRARGQLGRPHDSSSRGEDDRQGPAGKGKAVYSRSDYNLVETTFVFQTQAAFVLHQICMS